MELFPALRCIFSSPELFHSEISSGLEKDAASIRARTFIVAKKLRIKELYLPSIHHE